MLKMFVEIGTPIEITHIQKVMEDDKILSQFNEQTQSTDFSCLVDRVGEEMKVYKNGLADDTYTITSVDRDAKLEETMGKTPMYALTIKPVK